MHLWNSNNTKDCRIQHLPSGGGKTSSLAFCTKVDYKHVTFLIFSISYYYTITYLLLEVLVDARISTEAFDEVDRKV